MTLTTMFRADLYRDFLKEVDTIPDGGIDYALWLWLAAKCKFYFLPEVTAHYRMLSNSVSHNQSREKQEFFLKRILEIKRYYANRFLPEEDLETEWHDEYCRTCILEAMKYDDRLYCLEKLHEIKCLTKYDKRKLVLFKTKLGYSFFKKLSYWKSVIKK